MIARLRVLVREMPPLLRDIVENAVTTQEDMELVPDRHAAGPPRAETPDGPDVIVMASTDVDQSETSAADWLRWRPNARVVVIETTGLRSVMYEMRPKAMRLGELSREQLIEAIRTGFAERTPGGGPRN